MKPQFFALITAMAWGIGGHFEKKGLHLGHLSPQVGITIRTAVALVALSIKSASQWGTILQALISLVVGGGVVVGSVGMLCFYAAIHGAPLGQVMPIAFTFPFFGVQMGILIGGEPLTLKTILGMAMIGGIVLLTFG